MRYCLFVVALIGQLALVNAQTAETPSSRIRVGYSLGLSYNLYSWYRAPNESRGNKPYSTGQVLNILPGVGVGFWLGDMDHWLLSLETEVNFLPLALSVQQYNGLGVLELPTLLKLQVPLSRQQSLWTFVHVAAGVQWQQIDLYDRSVASKHQRQYLTWVGEIGVHLSAVAHKKHRLRELEYFIRLGAGEAGAFGWNTGLRLQFRNGNR